MSEFDPRKVGAEQNRLATSIAISVCGSRPDNCSGWKAKIFNAAYEGALAGMETAEECRALLLEAADSDIKLARRCAEDTLMARLPRADAAQREKLRARIAKVRSGTGDHLSEVETALLAIMNVRRMAA